MKDGEKKINYQSLFKWIPEQIRSNVLLETTSKPTSLGYINASASLILNQVSFLKIKTSKNLVF